MAIDTLNPNYCRSKGEQIALNVDGACADETSTYTPREFPKASELHVFQIRAFQSPQRYLGLVLYS